MHFSFRVLESYRKLQKVNQGLEDKLLRIADNFEMEKNTLTSNVQELSDKLGQMQTAYTEVYHEKNRYKNDFQLAVRLLQNHPSQFMSHDIDSVGDQHYMFRAWELMLVCLYPVARRCATLGEALFGDQWRQQHSVIGQDSREDNAHSNTNISTDGYYLFDEQKTSGHRQ